MNKSGIEIERKFLVKNFDFIDESFNKYEIMQGYLSVNDKSTIRVRTYNKTGYITIKSRSTDGGISRQEWEYEIPYEHAVNLLKICQNNIIEKTRYLVKKDNFLWEIDIFAKPYSIVIAEIELNDKDINIPKPLWIGEEVTGKKEYYNSYISQINE